MKTNWTVLIIEGVEYYTLKEICKELGYKTQKSFVEKFNNIVCTFKGIITGKFVSIDNFKTLFGKEEHNEEIEVVKEQTTEYQEKQNTSNVPYSEPISLPKDVKKKFARLLISKYHPDNNGDKNLFLWAKKLKESWEKPSYLDFLEMLDKMADEEFLKYMETYSGSDKDSLYIRRGFNEEGEFVF